MKLKNLKFFIRKCKSLSSQLRSFRSFYLSSSNKEEQRREIVYVGNSRRRYEIDNKHLSHPLMNALIEKPSPEEEKEDENEIEKGVDETKGKGIFISIKCEVVLFDHLLWMLENADPISLGPDQSLEDLAELYML